MTRYFMTIPEAAQLVIEAGGVGAVGRHLRARHGRARARSCSSRRTWCACRARTVEIRVTGIRPGEKLDEELFEGDEEVERTRHEKLQVARRGPIDVQLAVASGSACSRRGCSRATPTGSSRPSHETVRNPVRAMPGRDPATVGG